ncbi:hypothetical protein ACFU7T_02240 [Streptomyces sp. NPDC057555]|uniref:hypothetical protein n=1 Tax=Streptomyces sp. NPDC057555 TaxID=3346166 RepID=UPI003679A2DE
MPPDRTLHRRLKEAQLKRYEANIPREEPVETGDRRDFPVNVRAGARSGLRFTVRCDVRLAVPLGAFLAIPYLGNILVQGADARWVPAVVLVALAAAGRPGLRHQRRRAG